MKEFTLPLIKAELAEKIKVNLKNRVWLPNNKVLIAITNEDVRRSSGLIIPNQVAKEESLKKGVVVLKGHITEDYTKTEPCTGNIVTFGEYAGKKVSFETPIELDGEISVNNIDFHVLSLHEIVMEEFNYES